MGTLHANDNREDGALDYILRYDCEDESDEEVDMDVDDDTVELMSPFVGGLMQHDRTRADIPEAGRAGARVFLVLITLFSHFARRQP